jgi:diaminohydroxyphosphoribosylaminopyrimidine deaminase/5-amino-6-(5-phosphoribosylamino)uracil reductase
VGAPEPLTATDLDHLDAALALARTAGPSIEPDPYVGAIVVDPEGAVVGRGCHARFGGLHAEPIALAEAGERARGATLYCTLEPCCYDAPEKRQPPCTKAVIDAGVARVVIGAIDPHPRVNGSGVEALRAAGIDAVVAGLPERFLADSGAYLEMLKSLG